MMRKLFKEPYLRLRGNLLRCFAPADAVKVGVTLPESNLIKNILFIRIDRIGDMVLSTPAFRVLKKKYSKACLSVLASPANAAIIANNPFVDKVLTYDGLWSLPQKVSFLNSLYRRGGFDLALDGMVDYTLESALLCRASGAKIRIGYPEAGREVFFNVPLPPPERVHMGTLMLNLLAPLGIKAVGAPQPEIFLTNAEKRWAASWLNENNLTARTIIGIHPGAYYATQKWPAGYYAELADKLSRDKDHVVILFGSDNDRDALMKIAAGMESDKPIIFADSDLRRFLALLSQCRLLVCNNSGPLHMAAALSIPTVSFMGPTDGARWRPLGEKNIVLQRNELPCLGCESGDCRIKTNECMTGIKSTDVYDVIMKSYDIREYISTSPKIAIHAGHY